MTLAEKLVSRNALLGRYAFSQLRPMPCLISVGMYFTVVVLSLALGSVANYKHGYLDVLEFARVMFITLAVLQVLLLWIMGLYHAGSAIKQEVTEKSMDFFRLLPLSAIQKIVGVLAGRNLVALALAALNTVVLVVCGIVAQIQPLLMLEFVVFSWVGAVAVMLAAFLFSTFETKGRMSSGPMLVLLMSMFFLPYAIGIAATWHEIFPKGAFVSFYIWKIHLFVFLSLFAAYASMWFILGLVRRFANERAALFTPTGAILCQVGTLLIALGLGWTYFPQEREAAAGIFWMSTAFFTLAVILGCLRNWDEYVEVAGRTLTRPGVNPSNLSNLALGAALILLWAVFAAGADLLAGNVFSLFHVPVLVTFGLVLAALMEFSVTHAPLTLRVHMLAGFAAGLYAFLPLIVAGVTDWKEVLLFSPLGYVTILQDRSPGSWAPVALNLLLLILLGMFILRRYRAIPAGQQVSK